MEYDCCECGQPAGQSLVCPPCRKALTPGAASRITVMWHEIIRALAPVRDGLLQCFHCEQFFEPEMLAGDHFPFGKGARPDLRYHTGNGVPCCARCNTSGARTRKNWRLFVDRLGIVPESAAE